MKKGFDIEVFFDFIERYGKLNEDDFIEASNLSKEASNSSEESINLNQDASSFSVKTEELDRKTRFNMIKIPSGRFLMGSPETEEQNGESWEHPQRSVSVTSFWMSQTPITQGQWKAVASLPKKKIEIPSDPSSFQGKDLPVESVSWIETLEFCRRLSAKTGGVYRLPKEAEWEYACRAGTTTPFHFGETITTDLANFNACIPLDSPQTGKNRRKTSPVGYFRTPNAFDLHDMHGNVYEWCLDSWHPNYDGAPTDGSVWTEMFKNRLKVIRGGSWAVPFYQTRSASRASAYSDFKAPDIGLRVVARFWY